MKKKLKIGLNILFIFFILFSSLVIAFKMKKAKGQGEEWLSDYNYRLRITIRETDINEPLYDFPVLVWLRNGTHFNTTDFREWSGATNEIRFTDYDGVTILDYELETFWVGASYPALLYWVEIPKIDDNEDTIFYFYYGANSSRPDGSDAYNTWSNGFVAVYHMDNHPFAPYHRLEDSTGNGNDIYKVSNGIPTEYPQYGYEAELLGFAGYGQDFNGFNAYGNVTHDPTITFTSENFTISYAFNLTSRTNNLHLCKGLYQVDGFYIQETGNAIKFSHDRSGASDTVTSNTILQDDEWMYITYRRTGTRGEWWINGVNETASITNPPVEDLDFSTRYMRVGTYDNMQSQYMIDGVMDEIRLSSVQRSVEFIRVDYLSVTEQLLYFELENYSYTPNYEFISINYTSGIVGVIIIAIIISVIMVYKYR